MKKEKNIIWRFFSSLKLTLFNLFFLAGSSIIGTLIPQNETAEFYVKNFGPNLAKLFQVLNVPDMYNSWWYLFLLTLLSLNLIVCSFDRLPNVWRIMAADNLQTDPDRLAKMGNRAIFYTEAPPDEVAPLVQGILNKSWGKVQQEPKHNGIMMFSQKGVWTRLGVYTVHLSVLVIFAGAIIGSIYGYKASVMIPEGAAVDKVYRQDADHTPEPIGFLLKCDRFSLSLYDNGAPKEYRSDLVVYENDKKTYSKSIVVNDPMIYKGLTFYQSSYQTMENKFIAELKNDKTHQKQLFGIPPGQKISWAGEGVDFGIVNIASTGRMGQLRYKIWFSDGKAQPTEFWINESARAIIERPDNNYSFVIKQAYATGLQVVKDPGVWFVYTGCITMILGILVAFFLSHKRIWAYVGPDDGRTKILLSGMSNKNRADFKNKFMMLAEQFEKDERLNLSKESS